MRSRAAGLVGLALVTAVAAQAKARLDPVLFVAQDLDGPLGHFHKTGVRLCHRQVDDAYLAVAAEWCGGVPIGGSRAEGFHKVYRDPPGSRTIVAIKGPDGGPAEWYRIGRDHFGRTVRLAVEVLDWEAFREYRTFELPGGGAPELLGNGGMVPAPGRVRLTYRSCDAGRQEVHDAAEYHQLAGVFDLSTPAGAAEALRAWTAWSAGDPLGIPPQWTAELAASLGWPGRVWLATLRTFWRDFSEEELRLAALVDPDADASLRFAFEEQYDFLCIGASPFDCHGVGLAGWRVYFRPAPERPQRRITSAFYTTAVQEAVPTRVEPLCGGRRPRPRPPARD